MDGIPTRQLSTWSTSDSSTYSQMTGLDDGSAGGVPTFFSIFQDAAKYGDVLLEEPDALDDSESDASSITLAESTGADTLSGPDHPDGLENLIAQDLNINDNFNAATARLVQLSANQMNTAATGLDGTLLESVVPDSASEQSETPSQKKELSDTVIPVIINEFGPLAEEGEEEVLIAEADGSYFQVRGAPLPQWPFIQ